MKKLFIIILVLGLLSLPALANEQEVWNTEDNSVATEARVFTYGGAEGQCNKPQWFFDFTTTASVAQWIDWEISATSWEWYVRKPGDYYADCITFMLSSNGDVGISFTGFDNLEYQGSGGVDQYIDTYYFASNFTPTLDDWVPAAELENHNIIVDDSEALHNGLTFKLWNRINVADCNSACDYSNTGTVLITLLNQKDWIDAEGEWNL